MNKILGLLLCAILLTSCNFQDKDHLETAYFKLSLDNKGKLIELIEKSTGKNLLIPGFNAALLTIESDGEKHSISNWKYDSELLTLNFDKIGAKLTVKVQENEDYLTFEIAGLECDQAIDKVIWGPYGVLPSEKIGQSIGIAYDDSVAIGFMGLNLKSRGGFEILQRERFGNAAKKIEEGARLEGFVRDRSTLRVVDNWEQKQGQAVPVNDTDADIVGAKFAMYCVPVEQLKTVVENIIVSEGLPHIKNGKVWNKNSNYSTSSKFIMPYNVENIDDCINVASKAGITCVYHGWIFETWGTFKVREKDFPNGYASVRECSDKAEKYGINLGAHTLTNFVTTNDPMVSPKPHPGLVKAGITQLGEDISDADTELILLDESKRPAYYEPNLDKVNPRWRKHTAVQIGDEIIEYAFSTAEGQLVLKECKRGAFGTKAVAHKKGEKLARLMSHGYKVFFPDINLQDEMAKNLATFFNEANLKRISFDGIEGGLACGHGRYGCDRFVKVFYDHLNDPNIVANSSDVTHFGWHYFSNESWGEPWTSKNFREAHLDHRIKVQKGLKEDLLPRKMGQFSINERTTRKDMEWVMGLGAGYDAGVDFYISPNFEKQNREAAAILAEIKKWEEARMNGIFSEEQKEKLRDPYTFYGLEVRDGKAHLEFIESWAPEGGRVHGEDEVNTLPEEIMKSTPEQPVSLDYKHVNMTTEPGLPTSTTWEYYCAGKKQKLQYVIRLPKNAKEAVKGIYLKVGTQKCMMPFTLQPGDYILNKGNDILLHRSSDHQLKKELTLSEASLSISEGKNHIEFDYKGKGRVAGPEMIVNFRTKK
jgi:hypothetical protein